MTAAGDADSRPPVDRIADGVQQSMRSTSTAGDLRAVDDIVAGFRALSAQITEVRRARREAQRVARNARRRARRAAAAKAPKVVPAPVGDDDSDEESGCRCPFVRMPPCWFCESGGMDDAVL